MKQYFFLVALTVIALLPASAAAYDVLETASYQVTQDTYLFTIEFEYGYLNAEAWLPILTNQPLSVGETPELRFAVVDETDTKLGGIARGIVVSDAKQRESQYYIESGERERFTLVVVYQAPAVVASPGIEVTELTHLTRRTGETDFSVMNPSVTQLADYQVTVE